MLLECSGRSWNAYSLQPKVTQVKAVAKARNDQRKMANKYFVFIIPIVVIGCVVWMGIMMIINVRDRSTEIGVMRALGYGAVKISSLFLGKSEIGYHWFNRGAIRLSVRHRFSFANWA